MADSRFRVKAHSESPTKTIVKARQFEIVVDEPAELGGTDLGANPVEYVLAAFAGCLNVMAHVIAKELNFELRGVEIDLYGDLNPARLFGMSFDEIFEPSMPVNTNPIAIFIISSIIMFPYFDLM